MSLSSFVLLLVVLPAITLSQTTPDAKKGWQSGDNDRSSFDILWGCFSTIFACTWSVLHLNVSNPRESESRIFWRQVKWFILTIFIPEYLVAVAADQFWEARICVKSFEKSKLERVHSKDPSPPSSESQKVECEEETLEKEKTQPCNLTGGSPTIETTEISENIESNEHPEPEKSQQSATKASAYDDDWTLAHGFFTTMGGLAIQTEDKKEYSILKNDSPVKLLESGRVDFPCITTEDIKHRSKTDAFVKFIAVCQSTWFAINIVARPGSNLHVTPLELATAAYVLCAVIAYALWWHKPKDVTVPIIINVPSSPPPDTTTNTEEPTLKHYLDLIAPRKCNDFAGVSTLDLLSGRVKVKATFSQAELRRMNCASLVGLFVGLIYCGIHLTAWNFPFPTPGERKAWRICTLASISTAAALIPFYLPGLTLSKTKGVLAVLLTLDYFVGYFCYIIARIVLMVLMLMSFRLLPTSCYDTVDWLSALPHY
ncbi:uncharacterized protein TRUGW13939_03149 [Talaromyces rugulosus]|uniref:Uncharacterized protein n=1 Tax=Talaromyces rugulosus TaxID=121627 RepID=A0A7H8QQB1_TALRU|nr:uncharacterized protein TRUGW13939_03149 [Talaromyces rugulosus]QKX56049.1 hypothetical protein TRUGW13939_03149 [Talaromyces rugulosus]